MTKEECIEAYELEDNLLQQLEREFQELEHDLLEDGEDMEYLTADLFQLEVKIRRAYEERKRLFDLAQKEGWL